MAEVSEAREPKDIRQLSPIERQEEAALVLDRLLRQLTEEEAESIKRVTHSPVSGVVVLRFGGFRGMSIAGELERRGYVYIKAKEEEAPAGRGYDSVDSVVIIPEAEFGISSATKESKRTRRRSGELDLESSRLAMQETLEEESGDEHPGA